MKEDLLRFLQGLWQNHRGRSIGLLSGVFFGVSVLLFGFWRMLFVIFCAGIGMYIGSKIERVGGFAEFLDMSVLQRLFRRIT